MHWIHHIVLFGSPAFKALKNIGEGNLFQISHEKWWPAQWNLYSRETIFWAALLGICQFVRLVSEGSSHSLLSLFIVLVLVKGGGGANSRIYDIHCIAVFTVRLPEDDLKFASDSQEEDAMIRQVWLYFEMYLMPSES